MHHRVLQSCKMIFRILLVIAIFACNARANNCPGDFVPVGDYCYMFIMDENKNFQDSEDLCVSKGVEANLTTPTGLAQLKDCNQFSDVIEYAKEFANLPEKWSYWVGAKDENTEGHWYWLDEERTPVEMGVPMWGVGENYTAEPSGGNALNCACLSAKNKYYMRAGNCEGGNKMICQIL